MGKNYKISTQFDSFEREEISEDRIKETLDKVFDDEIAGVSNFIVLDNKDSDRFIQGIFSDGEWILEYSPKLENIYKIKHSDYKEVYNLFIEFYNNGEIDYSNFERMDFNLL